MNQVHNFNAGPAVLPRPGIVRRRSRELLDFRGTGCRSWRSATARRHLRHVLAETEADLRELLGIPAAYKVLFLAGRRQPAVCHAAHEFDDRWADPPITSSTAPGARQRSRKPGSWVQARLAGSSESTGFDRTPQAIELRSRGSLPALHLQRDHPRRAVLGRACTAAGRAAGLRYVIGFSEPSD